MAAAETNNMTTLQVKRFKPSENPTNTYLTDEKGVWAWMTTVDHKKIGLMYLASVAFFFAFAGFLAIALRTELWEPATNFIDADTYNKYFTLHGAMMVFFVLIPSIPAALGNFVLPMQLGAKDVAFPRLNLASFYIYVIGAIFTFISLAYNGFDTGWTFYTPYSSTGSTGVIWVTLGVFILGFSSILTGTNFITTIHKLRAPGLPGINSHLISGHYMLLLLFRY